MKPRMLIMALSIHFYDILSSFLFFLQVSSFSIFLDVHADQFDFQPSFKEEITLEFSVS